MIMTNYSGMVVDDRNIYSCGGENRVLIERDGYSFEPPFPSIFLFIQRIDFIKKTSLASKVTAEQVEIVEETFRLHIKKPKSVLNYFRDTA